VVFCQFQSFNPISEPFDGWEGREQRSSQSRDFNGLANHAESNISENDFTFPCEGISEEDDEVTESKIKDFLDEKVFFMLEPVQIHHFWLLVFDYFLFRCFPGNRYEETAVTFI
jgi:hypothetical protein